MTKFIHKGGQPCEQPLHYKGCGLDDVYLVNGFDKKSEGYVIHNQDDLHKAIGLHIVTERKVITPKELRFLRNLMDKSQRELGEIIGQSSQQVARWEKGQSEIPGPAERLIRVLFMVSTMPLEERAKLLEDIGDRLKQISLVDETRTPKATFRSTTKGWKEEKPKLAA
jgi:DNA-binding transcriptional regulator YiaG